MADWEALRAALLWVGWPGLVFTSTYAIARAIRFYRSLHYSAPGLLVLLTISGWVVTLGGAALVTTLYVGQSPEQAGPVAIPTFILWAGSMVTIVWVVHRWGEETTTLDTYYGEIERMERMKNGFINHVAHELNTPITPLRMQVAIMRREALGPLTEKQGKSLDRMDRCIDRLSALVQQVLMASYLQSGRIQVEAAQEDLNLLVHEAAQVVAAEGTEIEVADVQPVLAMIDRERMGYAVQALLSYVARRSEGTAMVKVWGDGAWAHVEVCYQGPAMSDKDFRAFGDPAAAAEADGLAVDLFNVHGIVGLHGGRVVTGGTGVVEIRVPVARHPPVRLRMQERPMRA